MQILFAFEGFIIRRDGNVVTVDKDGAIVATHGMGATTLTGTAGPLTTAQRKAVWAHLRGQEGGP